MVSLFYFYSNSAVRAAGLEQFQELLGDPQLKVKETRDVRWLSHQKTVATIVRTFPSLIASLQSEADDRGNLTALGLFTLMTKLDFLCALVMINDYYFIFRNSRSYSKGIWLTLVSYLVNSTIAVINQRLTSEFSKKCTKMLRVWQQGSKLQQL